MHIAPLRGQNSAEHKIRSNSQVGKPMYNFTGVSAWARLSFIFSQSPGAVAAFPELPGPTSVVDNIFSRDLRTAPHRACQAFGLRERLVGAPAALFARKAQQKNMAHWRTAPIGRGGQCC